MRIDDVHAPQPPSTSPTGPAPHDEATALLRQVAPHATRGLTPEALATHLEDAQRRHGLPTTGEPDAATLEALRREASWIDHERAAHEADDAPQEIQPRAPRSPHLADPRVQLMGSDLAPRDEGAVRRAATLRRQLPSLDPSSRRDLAERLDGLSPERLADDLATLRGAAGRLRARASRAYVGMGDVRAELPDPVARALLRGVGEPAGSAPGSEGLFGAETAELAAQVYAHLPEDVRGELDGLLARVGAEAPDTERALLLEAVTARWQDIRAGRTDLSEVTAFADAIRGLDREALVRGTTVLDVDGGVGLLQRDPRACTQACALVIRAEADPVVAWELTSVMGQRGERPHASDAGVLETYARFTEGRWGAPQMGPSLRLYDQSTNRGYVAQQADTPAGRARIAALLERGVDVYLGVRWEGGSGHATVLTDVRGEGARREVRLFDPSSGRSSWVNLSELGDFELNGSRARAGLFHDSARGRRDAVTWDPGAGRPVATDSLFERLR